MKKSFIFILTIGLISACGVKKEYSPATSSSNEISSSTAETVEDIEVDSIIERPVYHGSPTILTDIIHTKLAVDFDWENAQMNGVATLTCSPHFYATDSLILDAKAMEILSVKVNDKALNYKYNDANFLRIGLDRKYQNEEEYNIVINYIAKPEDKDKGGSSAITSDKGLYFINPRGENKSQMPQIWTQGESESSSVWFPTIDRPNQKTTQEIYMTVDDKYVTLSNGALISSTKNADGTRTDYWKQELPHAPYLFMMAVGEFEIVKDSYTKKDGTVMAVDYYVEPEWKEHAQAIFGDTPRMIAFFSDLLGVEYVWDKYHQIIVREYVSGAMENTGATVFGDFAYKTKRELIDSDDESTIAHELFHHWFGDLVTIESWSNLPLNESFANYSQYLWAEHKDGKDQADYDAEKEKDGYYASASQGGHHNMIWYDYDYHDQMFDAHSYNKGGRILHMLRTYLGDEAFFAGLKDYLVTYAFKTVEMDNLRMSFEKVSGEDLNWFFNQWFFAERYPEINISQEVSDGEVTVKIEQTQNLENTPLYKLPMRIGVYANDKKKSYQVTLNKNINTFTFKYEGKLQNIVVDEDRATLGKFKHDKPREWYIHQYYNAPTYIDRKEAVNYGSRLRTDEANQMLLDALNDDFWAIRTLAISKLDRLGVDKKEVVYTKLKELALTDKKSHVRSAALRDLATQYFKGGNNEGVREVLIHAIENDSSYLVVSTGLTGLAKGKESDVKNVLAFAKQLESEQSGVLKAHLFSIYKDYGNSSNLDFMAKTLKSNSISGYNLIGAVMNYSAFIKKQDVAVQNQYFDVLESLANEGGAYMKYVIPMTLVGIQQNTKELKTDLSEELEGLEKEGKTGEATLVQRKVNEADAYLKRINKLINELNK